MPIRSHFASKQAVLSGTAARSASASVQSEFQKSPRFLDLEDWRDQLMREASENVQLKLGDASIASPFTCKSTGIDKGNSRNRPFFSSANSSVRTLHAGHDLPDLHHSRAQQPHRRVFDVRVVHGRRQERGFVRFGGGFEVAK